MKFKSFVADAFTRRLFGGNPAAVVLLDEWLEESLLKSIASENNLPETAFLVKTGEGFHLRWFTPDIEMDLCGHATLASAHIIFTETGFKDNIVNFNTVSGILKVRRVTETQFNEYELEFPKRVGAPSDLPENIANSLSIKPVEVLKARDYMLVYSHCDDVANIKIERGEFDKINLGNGGVIITAPGIECDFVSRFFTPGATLFEDPVTGSAHCTLAPYWSERLGKDILSAKQLSDRGGELVCRVGGDTVFIKGSAITYSESYINI